MNNPNNGLGGVGLTEAQAWETLGRYFEDYSNLMTYEDGNLEAGRTPYQPACVCDAIHAMYDQDLIDWETKWSMSQTIRSEAELRGISQNNFFWTLSKLGMADRSDFCWKQRARVLDRDEAEAERAMERKLD